MRPPLPFILAAAVVVATAGAREFDLLIRDALIVDGTGAAAYRGDLGVNGDTIAAVGRLPAATAKTVIDARGRVLAPGFIDLHAHLDEKDGLDSADPRRRAAQNYVAQGITTALINQDGSQPASLTEQRRRYTATGIGVNVALANGHDTLRRRVLGEDLRRPANAAERAAMRELLRHSLAHEGSFGLSLGLEYFSALHADTDEILALAHELPAFNGIFIAHLRSQGAAPMWYKPSLHGANPPPNLRDALAEAIQVGEQTGVLVVATHIKGWGPGYRGKSAETIATIDAARARGVRIFADIYPYDSAGSDGDFVALPPWAITPPEGEQRARGPRDHRPALQAILADAAKMENLRRDVEHQVALKGGAENVHVLDYPDRSYVGRTLAQLMATRGLDLPALVIALQLEGDPHKPGGVKLRAISMEQRDVDNFVLQPWCAGSTDGWIVLPEEAVGVRKYLNTNRRCFGSYVWRLINYTRDRPLQSLEESVRKCTTLPAELLNLRDRGRLAAGLKADFVLLDIPALRDNTTITEPNEYPDGVDYVFVNGTAVVSEGQRTLALPGRVLTPAGAQLRGATDNP